MTTMTLLLSYIGINILLGAFVFRKAAAQKEFAEQFQLEIEIAPALVAVVICFTLSFFSVPAAILAGIDRLKKL